jgi:hypothetical protein
VTKKAPILKVGEAMKRMEKLHQNGVLVIIIADQYS